MFILLQQVETGNAPVKFDLDIPQWIALVTLFLAIMGGYTYLARRVQIGLSSMYSLLWTVVAILGVYSWEFFTGFPRKTPLSLEELFFFTIIPGFVAGFGCEVGRRTGTLGVDHKEALKALAVALAVKIAMFLWMAYAATPWTRQFFAWDPEKTWKLEVWAVPILVALFYLSSYPAHKYYKARWGDDTAGEIGGGSSRTFVWVGALALLAVIVLYAIAYNRDSIGAFWEGPGARATAGGSLTQPRPACNCVERIEIVGGSRQAICGNGNVFYARDVMLVRSCR